MIKLTKQVQSKHDCEYLYDLVNDTDEYTNFLPFCTQSQVLSQEDNKKTCLLVFSKGPVEQKLVTRNELQPHRRIDFFLEEGPFSHLYGYWTFEPKSGGTIVKLYIEYAFSHTFIQMTFGPFFKSLSHELVEVFCERADELKLY